MKLVDRPSSDDGAHHATADALTADDAVAGRRSMIGVSGSPKSATVADLSQIAYLLRCLICHSR